MWELRRLLELTALYTQVTFYRSLLAFVVAADAEALGRWRIVVSEERSCRRGLVLEEAIRGVRFEGFLLVEEESCFIFFLPFKNKNYSKNGLPGLDRSEWITCAGGRSECDGPDRNVGSPPQHGASRRRPKYPHHWKRRACRESRLLILSKYGLRPASRWDA